MSGEKENQRSTMFPGGREERFLNRSSEKVFDWCVGPLNPHPFSVIFATSLFKVLSQPPPVYGSYSVSRKPSCCQRPGLIKAIPPVFSREKEMRVW
jgi:hypothetical protein